MRLQYAVGCGGVMVHYIGATLHANDGGMVHSINILDRIHNMCSFTLTKTQSPVVQQRFRLDASSARTLRSSRQWHARAPGATRETAGCIEKVSNRCCGVT